jgi:hypothetical protein
VVLRVGMRKGGKGERKVYCKRGMIGDRRVGVKGEVLWVVYEV